MHVGYDRAAHRNASPVLQFVLLLIVAIATVLGVGLALEYPKPQPACGPPGRFDLGCEAVMSRAEPPSAVVIF